MHHRQGRHVLGSSAVVSGLDVNSFATPGTPAERPPQSLSRNLSFVILDRVVDRLDCCPWGTVAGRNAADRWPHPTPSAPLYTPEERRRRDVSPWTLVQGVLAPVQFAIFLVSLGFVLHYLATGRGLYAASASIVVKTLALYTIMITGSLWERDVFGRYLFARAFFWEDVFSFLVLGLHTAYLAALFSGAVSARGQMLLALAAYAAYCINAAQFVLKLRAARREQGGRRGEGHGALGLSQ